MNAMTEGSPALPPLREVIARFGLHATRSLGQNFLLDLNLTRRIAAAAAPLAGITVLEVGPGPGGLTRALLASGPRRVVAVERDRRAVAALGELAAFYHDRLQVIEGDALDLDEAKVLGPDPAKLVANLPYNIATALLIKWLAQPHLFQTYVLMFQKEVAERLAAAPGTKAYGRLSVITQWRTEVKRLFDVPPRAFTPPPKVTSSVVRLVPRKEPLFPAEARLLERVTAAAFGQRRKMLRQSLKILGPAEAILRATGIDATARAEDLTIGEFCALARALDARGDILHP
jgi:16S rRNA (adenine1518-N6/adenine1519-N6)-dimethyltransferase